MNTRENGRAGHPILWTLGVLAAAAVAFAGYLVFAPGPTAFAQGKRIALADYHDKDPTGVPDELKSASLVERGEYLTRAADCVVCHTANGGEPFAGGRAFVLPFGTMYSTNITPDADLAAMVTYLRTVASVATGDLPEPRAAPAAATFVEGVGSHASLSGRAVYEGACAGCHGWTGISPGIASATLTGTRAVNDATAINVAQVVIRGGERQAEAGPSNMPAFGSTYSDSEIASVANYVTARFGAKASDLTVDQVAKLRTQD